MYIELIVWQQLDEVTVNNSDHTLRAEINEGMFDIAWGQNSENVLIILFKIMGF